VTTTAKRAPRSGKTHDVNFQRKRLVVFCDGTWNDLRMRQLTNVARLAKCVEPRGWDGRRQVVFYDSGVGVATGVGRLPDKLVSVLGGAIGAGLDDKIESAYRFLVLNYEAGDEVFVFGFSRGAYTARSLCGLIRKCGIVRRNCFSEIPRAMELYRDTSRAPDHADLVKFREACTHRDPRTGLPLATGAKDLKDAAAWNARALDFHTPDAAPPEKPRANPAKARETDDKYAWLPPEPPPLGIYRLMYLGLWDTVGSMGVPNIIPGLSRLVNRRFKFYDPDASSLLFSIRHACALDEDRKSFDITPVRNIDKLNHAWALARGKQVDDETNAATYVKFADRPYQQQWFPGTHGSVGGGNPEEGISSAALVWIAVGALRAGLKFDWSKDSELGQAKLKRNPLAPFRIKADPKDPKKAIPLKPWAFDGIGFMTGYADRIGAISKSDPTVKNPTTLDELNDFTLQRLRTLKAAKRQDTYLPATLKFYAEQEGYAKTEQDTPQHRRVAMVARAVAVVVALVVLALLAVWVARRVGLVQGFL